MRTVLHPVQLKGCWGEESKELNDYRIARIDRNLGERRGENQVWEFVKHFLDSC